MTPTPRVTQLARILNREARELADDAGARSAINKNTDTVAEALFQEAADSDDVVSTGTALEYMEGRIAFFGDLIEDDAASGIRDRFTALVAQWDA